MMLQLIYSPVLPILHATGLERIQSFCAQTLLTYQTPYSWVHWVFIINKTLMGNLMTSSSDVVIWYSNNIPKMKSIIPKISAPTCYHSFSFSALLSPLLYPGLSLFLQLSHCGTADWATSLYHKALSVEARSQLAESFPRFLHALVVLPFHPCSHSDTVASSVQVCCWWVRSGTATIWVRAKEAACTF